MMGSFQGPWGTSLKTVDFPIIGGNKVQMVTIEMYDREEARSRVNPNHWNLTRRSFLPFFHRRTLSNLKIK